LRYFEKYFYAKRSQKITKINATVPVLVKESIVLKNEIIKATASQAVVGKTEATTLLWQKMDALQFEMIKNINEMTNMYLESKE